MKLVTAFGLTAVLTSVLATPGLPVVSSEQAREANARNQVEPSGQTTTPSTSSMSSTDTPRWNGTATNQPNSHPIDTSAACGGTC